MTLTIKVTDEAARIIAKFRECKRLDEHKSMVCDAFSAASSFCMNENYSESSLWTLWAINEYSELINELAKTE